MKAGMMAGITGEAGPDEGQAAPAAMGYNEICVPSDALGTPEEGEQMVQPEQGDRVQFSGEGVVSRAENGKTYLKVETVNGKPAGNDEKKPDDMAQLQTDAEQVGYI